MNGQNNLFLIFIKYNDFFLTGTGQYERTG